LQANTGSGLSYKWYRDGSLISGAAGSAYAATQAGSYRVEVTNSSGCSALSAPFALQMTASPAGSQRLTAIDFGTVSSCGETKSMSQSNSPGNCYGNNFGQSSDDIFYRFELTHAAQVNISHCGSPFDTYMHLLDANGNVIAQNDDYGPLCFAMQASISRQLTAGVYYVVSEGYGNNSGLITTTISTVPPQVMVAQQEVSLLQGMSAPLSASGASTYSWSPSTGLSSATGATVTASPAATTVYTVTGTSAGGCVSTATVVVTVAQNTNHIIANTILQPGKRTDADLAGLTVDQRQQQITYFDGLGRPMQEVITQGSPSKKDIVTPTVYDQMGRSHKQYLPYAEGNNGFYKPDALSRVMAFYAATGDKVANDTVPYIRTLFEKSPLGRALEKASGPGSDWRVGTGKTLRFTERVNDTDEVRLWAVDSGTGGIAQAGYYQQGQLRVLEATDEEGALIVEYKDRQGRVLVRKVQEANTVAGTRQEAGFLVTQYVYDDFGNLRLVIQPEGLRNLAVAMPLSQTFIDNWCFYYEYDALQRIVKKQVPGAGAVLIAYNKRDLPVLTQDAVQRARNEWSFTKYDALNRPVMAGRVVIAKTLAGVQGDLDAEIVLHESDAASGLGYTLNGSYPRGLAESNVESITYYDHYGYQSIQNGAYAFTGNNALRAAAVRGQVTGGRVRQLDGAAAGPWLTSVNYYDREYRLLESVADNHLGGKDRVANTYDFVGKVEETVLTHTKGSATRTVRNVFAYDHAGRLLTNTQQTDGQPPVLLAKHEYNELGQQVDKKLHSTDGGASFLQSVDHRYNIRGWLTHINNSTLSMDENNDEADDMFGMELTYNKTTALAYSSEGGTASAKPFHNGNISETVWMSFTDHARRAYSYDYDRAGRITTANYHTQRTDGENFRMWGVTYDGNGNLKAMKRMGLRSEANGVKAYGQIDDLSYKYETGRGNLLLGVDDTQLTASTHDFEDKGGRKYSAGLPEYDYDANGSMTKDDNKGITEVRYNHLNLPYYIAFAPGSRIEYVYSAAGVKLQKRVYQNNMLSGTTDYAAGFVYEQGEPVFVHTAEGRAIYRPEQTYKWKYEYFIKDHLGNLRLTFKDGDVSAQQLTMEQVNAEEEEREFERVAQSRRRDRSRARTGQHSAMLNAKKGLLLGPSKKLEVRRGDRIEAEVYGHYQQEVKDNWLYTVAAALLGNTGVSIANNGKGGEAAKPQGGKFPYLAVGIALAPPVKQRLKGVPAAYIKYIAYDTAGAYLGSEYRVITREALDNWQQLRLEYKAQQDGYVEVFLANESGEDVWFDDMSIQSTPLDVQENHYDPWGLNLAGIERQGSPDHKFQYNSMEKQQELGLNWTDYGARMYDPQLGRWHVVDPLADEMRRHSPYNYAFNNPIRFIDPDGMSPQDCPTCDFQTTTTTISTRTATEKVDGEKLGVTKVEQNSQTTAVPSVVSVDGVLVPNPNDIKHISSSNISVSIDGNGKIVSTTISNNEYSVGPDGKVIEGSKASSVQKGALKDGIITLPNGDKINLSSDFSKTVAKASEFERQGHTSFALREAESSLQATNTAVGIGGIFSKAASVVGIAMGFVDSPGALAQKGVELSSKTTRTILGQTRQTR
ncbi:MAG: DUF6443 domain-containing protein, partial [Pontibacter sp.]|nr:DUF6443 domain-containing protein [Pontibacter sp.]